jgi:hypothetical protein
MAFLNATTTAFSQSTDYFSVLDEVSKLNVHLNQPERLWAVCDPRFSAMFSETDD